MIAYFYEQLCTQICQCSGIYVGDDIINLNMKGQGEVVIKFSIHVCVCVLRLHTHDDVHWIDMQQRKEF